MTTATRLTAADELLALPERDVLYELIDGALHTMAPAGGKHRAFVGRADVDRRASLLPHQPRPHAVEEQPPRDGGRHHRPAVV